MSGGVSAGKQCRPRAGASLLALAALAVAGASGAGELTLNDAVYSRQQARAGKKLFERHCISCHGRQYFGPVMALREGQPLSELFDVMTALMPQNAPGSLSDEEYLDIIAYIMSLERYPDGERELALADLGSIEIRRPE